MENNINSFEKFVKIHDKLRLKRHAQGDRTYSDYDSMLGFCLIMIPIGFIFVNSFFGTMAITLTILFFVLNNIEFTKKQKFKVKRNH